MIANQLELINSKFLDEGTFRLGRDHKVGPLKSKMYKGYGQLHYFSLEVPSLHFIVAKFASEEYSVLSEMWSRMKLAIDQSKSASHAYR